MDSKTISPLISGFLLGKHVELRLRNGDITRGIVVRLRLAGARGVTLAEERSEDYHVDIQCWVPRRPREERDHAHKDIESIMVIDRNETLTPEKWT